MSLGLILSSVLSYSIYIGDSKLEDTQIQSASGREFQINEFLSLEKCESTIKKHKKKLQEIAASNEKITCKAN